jgi:hypothetical protein
MEERLPIPKEILIRALLTVEEAENRALIKMAGDLPELTQEEKEANLQKLLSQIKNTPAPVKKAVVVRSKRKIITYIIVAAILMSLICMSVTAIREPIFNFFVNIYDRFTAVAIYDSGDSGNEAIEKLEFKYIPDGYKLESEFSELKMERYIWNDGTNKIIFTHYLAGENTEYRFNTEYDHMQKISINDINALYHWQHNRQIITWTKNNEVFTLDCPIDMQLEDMIDIIKNMTVEDK